LLVPQADDSILLHVDVGAGRRRLGGTSLAQVSIIHKNVCHLDVLRRNPKTNSRRVICSKKKKKKNAVPHPLSSTYHYIIAAQFGTQLGAGRRRLGGASFAQVHYYFFERRILNFFRTKLKTSVEQTKNRYR